MLRRRAGAVLTLAGLLVAGAGSPLAAQQLIVQGTVRTEAGDAAEGVQVMLELSDMRIRRPVANLQARTDPAGSFTMDLSAHADIPTLGLEFSTLSPRYREAVKIVIAEQSEFPLTVGLTVAAGGSAGGIVVDEEGKPVPEALLDTGAVNTSTSDSGGLFTLYGLPFEGTAWVRVSREGYMEETASFELVDGRTGEDLRIVLRSSAPMEGRLLDPRGEPLSDVTVVLQVGENFRNTRTMKDGRFLFGQAPAKLEGAFLAAEPKGLHRINHRISEEEAQARRVELRTKWPLRFAGQVLDVAGKPAGGVVVQVEKEVEPTSKRARDRQPTRTTTDADGRWRIGPLDPGASYRVTAFPAESSARRESGELEFLREEGGKWIGEVKPWPGDYESVFEATVSGETITMKRRDSGAGGAAGEVVYTGTVDKEWRTIEGKASLEATGATGEFTARAYNPTGSLLGVWDLRSRLGEGKSLYAPSALSVRAAPFAGTQVMKLRLAPSGSLKGRAVDAEGRPLVEGRVVVVEWDGAPLSGYEAPIGPGGTFSMDGLPEGVLTVLAYDGLGGRPLYPMYLRAGLEGVELRADRTDDPMDVLP